MSALLLQFWPYILAGLAALAGYFKLRSSIVKAERAKQAERDLKARRKADEVERDVNSMTADQARKELDKWSAR